MGLKLKHAPGIILIALLAILLLTLISMFVFDVSARESWFQAIGAVCALIAAVLIPYVQREYDSAVTHEAEQLKQLQANRRVVRLILEARSMIKSIQTDMKEANWIGNGYYREMIANFLDMAIKIHTTDLDDGRLAIVWGMRGCLNKLSQTLNASGTVDVLKFHHAFLMADRMLWLLLQQADLSVGQCGGQRLFAGTR